MSESSLLDRLAADFPKGEVRQRDGGRGIKLDYIDVVQTINRLCNVLGANWDWRVLDAKVELIEQDGPKYLAYERGELHVFGVDPDRAIIRSGAGADVDARDPDKAIKTADAEALKKAGHKFQIALYLWDEGKRNEIAEYRKLTNSSVPQLKKAVAIKAGTNDGKELVDVLERVIGGDRTLADLQKPEVLLEYLAA